MASKGILVFALLAFTLTPQGFPAPQAGAAFKPVPATYDELLHAIRETRAASQARIEARPKAKPPKPSSKGRRVDFNPFQAKDKFNY
jgi:hypothetical protein